MTTKPGSAPGDFVSGAAKLISVYGRWPDFHDAEVLSAFLDRKGPSLVIQLECHETTRDVDERGFYRKKNRCLVTLRFLEIEDLSIQDFNHQNVVAAIVLERENKVRVTIQGIFGIHAQLQCSEVVVDGVVTIDN